MNNGNQDGIFSERKCNNCDEIFKFNPQNPQYLCINCQQKADQWEKRQHPKSMKYGWLIKYLLLGGVILVWGLFVGSEEEGIGYMCIGSPVLIILSLAFIINDIIEYFTSKNS